MPKKLGDKVVTIKDDYKGYEILYNIDKQQFEAWKNKEFVSAAPTQKQIQQFIDERYKKSFKRIPAILPSYNDVDLVRITSFVSERDEMRVWVVDEKGGASKHSLRCIYERTPENMKVVDEVKRYVKQTKQLDDDIQKLFEKFKNPITEENIETLGGLK